MDRPISEPERASDEHAAGNTEAASELLPLVYEQLRALAGQYMKGERRNHTLQPTALVHEAYVRLVGQNDWKGKTHFLALAAIQMRRVLVEHARRHNAAKRGGGLRRVTLDDRSAITGNGIVDVLELDEVLEKLTQRSPRQGKVFELRFFGGLSVEQTAHALDVSERTVKDDWRLAKARLRRHFRGADRQGG